MNNLTALTARQFEILSHVALGKSHQQIAADLFIHVSTINGAMTALVDKLEVPDGYKPRAYAVALWWQAHEEIANARALQQVLSALKTVFTDLSQERIS